MKPVTDIDQAGNVVLYQVANEAGPAPIEAQTPSVTIVDCATNVAAYRIALQQGCAAHDPQPAASAHPARVGRVADDEVVF